MNTIHIKVHHSFSEIQSAHWDELLAESTTDVPFLRYGYLERWWQYRGGGEWPPEAQLCIYTGWDEDQLVGIAPLFGTINQQGKQTLHLLGSVEISDYLDFLIRPEYVQIFIKALLAYMGENPSGPIDTLSLVNIPQDSPTLSALAESTHELGWKMKIEKASHTPAIQLADDWDTYLARIDKKQRHEIRRKLRRAGETPESVKWHILKEPQDLQKSIEAFIQLMAQDDQKKIFLTAPMRDQMSTILEWAFSQGFLQLSFLEIDGEKAATYCCFDNNNRILVYNSGFDMRFSSYSPGWVLLSYLIQHAITERKTHFDFMRGDETYKYRFGAVDSFVMKAVITR